MIGICNASPIIYLAKLGSLDLLKKNFVEVLTTNRVKNEVLATDSIEKIEIEEALNSWLKVIEISNVKRIERLSTLNIHEGEASILVLAEDLKKESDSIVIIDESAAREIGRVLNLSITGTLGILLRSTKRKIISSTKAKELLKILTTETPFRVSNRILLKIIEEIEKIE